MEHSFCCDACNLSVLTSRSRRISRKKMFFQDWQWVCMNRVPGLAILQTLLLFVPWWHWALGMGIIFGHAWKSPWECDKQQWQTPVWTSKSNILWVRSGLVVLLHTHSIKKHRAWNLLYIQHTLSEKSCSQTLREECSCISPEISFPTSWHLPWCVGTVVHRVLRLHSRTSWAECTVWQLGFQNSFPHLVSLFLLLTGK